MSRDFRSEEPLHPKAQELLSEFFNEGWVDPTKLHHQSRRLNILVTQAKEDISQSLGTKVDELEFVGELGFGYWSAIAGALSNCPGTFFYSKIDRQIVHAFARTQLAAGRKTLEISPGKNGTVDFNGALPAQNDFLVWQATNREIGVQQEPLDSALDPILFADMTAATPFSSLPERWDVALFDPRNFRGPAGIAILAISTGSRWRSPLPPMDQRRVFGSYSLPLLLATAVALTESVKNRESDLQKLERLNLDLRNEIARSLPDFQLIKPEGRIDPRYIALGVPNSAGEELLQNMERLGFLIDAGSACGAGALSPSHVLDSIGWQGLGHLRLTLKPEHNTSDIAEVIAALKKAFN